MIHVNCSICGDDNSKSIYSRIINTGTLIGKIKSNLVMCKNCGLMYMNPCPTQETMFHYYSEENNASSNMFHENNSSSRHGILALERKKFISKYIAKKKSGKLLEVGCTNGEFLASLNFQGWYLLGLEMSPYSEKKASELGLNIICGTIEATDFGKQKFDVICCFSTLEHFFDPDLALKKMTNILTEEGNMMIEVPNSTKPIAQIGEFYIHEHLTHFTLGTLEHLLAKHDIQVIGIDKNPSIVSIIRVWGKRKTGYSKTFVPNDDRDILLSVLAEYQSERKKIEEKIKQRFKLLVKDWAKKSSKVAIYGAGVHSFFLLSTVDLEENITCFFDSDPKKKNGKFLKWTIYGPESIANLDIDVIIISSKDYQEEIYRSIAHHQKKGVEIVRCYD